MSGILSDVAAQKEWKRRDKDARRQAEADVREVMSTPAGRRFVWRLLDICNVFGASYTSDTHATAHYEGQRFQGIRLMNEVQRLCPKLYLTMVTERMPADLPPEAVPEADSE